MANLVIASHCNVQCDYCFARHFLQGRASQSHNLFIGEAAYQARLDFLERSGIKEVRLIGGEPGLHPQFSELVREANKRAQTVVVFSNGTFNKRALETLEAIPPSQLTVMVNLAARLVTERQKGLRDRALKRLGPRVHVGYTIQQVGFNASDLIPLILENNCRKAIRLGLAMPSLAGRTTYLTPREYPLVGDSIADLSRRASKEGIRVEFDCGFVRCMFRPGVLEELKSLGVSAEFRCSPVLDIDLEDEVSYCFPMAARFRAPFDPQVNADTLRKGFAQAVLPFRQAGIYKECSSCSYKLSEVCTGGCLAATVQRFNEASFQVPYN